MSVEIREVGPEALEQYGRVPIRFRVDSVLHVVEVAGGLGGLLLREKRHSHPYVKDYDGQEEGGPTRWPERFDVSDWGFFLAVEAGRPVGGATVACPPPHSHALEGRTDLAVLWDIRVHPERRRQGIGTALFQRGAEWAREQGGVLLKVETQNVNVGACRFYARQGCHLGGILRHGYRGVPHVAHEVMLLWYLDV